MKGMPGLYYATRDSDRPERIGSALYVNGDTAEVRRLYRREDAAPMPIEKDKAGRHSTWSVTQFVRRLVGAGATA
jgi:hypothetical protein